MAKQNKNLKRTRDWLNSTDDFESLPEIEKIRYVRKRRKGAYRNGRNSAQR